MDVRTFRARTLQEALVLVRRELGPSAAVLQTREIRRGWFPWLTGRTEIEVVASCQVNVPSRFAQAAPAAAPTPTPFTAPPASAAPRPSPTGEHRSSAADPLEHRLEQLQQMVEKLYQSRSGSSRPEMPDELFRLFTELLDAEMSEELARELIERVRSASSPEDAMDPVILRARLARLVEEEIAVSGPIRAASGSRRIVALVGPTGVGKTTTIAKLAANYHLRDRRRVGLITVDTYRVAAVEQLRTYADIIDLPMEVVAAVHEMPAALERLSDMELVLIDTAGRSPADDAQIDDLKTLLAAAHADDVQLVLSAAASLGHQKRVVERFSAVGPTAILLTKLDEAVGVGNLLPLLRSCRLPLSYLTHGQNVPDDIMPANARTLARIILGWEHLAPHRSPPLVR
ncbi:MAG: flagellar biosynthesis protein FlhF [Pirellulaceae bacterium]|nr:MAG: flagellar biosynthesis protein FlhF [Pirellulaceae bacterium]GIW93244.1 MAG: flagellar biosynthesis protein FlhF [Pirellulaceae bacterium]